MNAQFAAVPSVKEGCVLHANYACHEVVVGKKIVRKLQHGLCVQYIKGKKRQIDKN